MRIVFMGTAALACPSLAMLLTGDEDDIVAVVSQPDRPRGRGLTVCSSPVRESVEDRGIKVLTPTDVNSRESLDALAALRPDLIVVVAYGQILKPELLSIPTAGCVNLHASLLPKYRGAAPIQWAIASGEKVSGVTTMYMNERMDAGDIILQREVPITDDDSGGSLQEKLAEAGAVLLAETIAGIRGGHVRRVPQNEALATHAPKLRKTDGKIDWTASAKEIYNRVRAFNPWPCCFCEAPAGAGRFLKVLRVSVEQGGQGNSPGDVLSWSGAGPLVRAADQAVRLLEVQPEGRKRMDGRAYLCGYAGMERFG